MQDVLTLILGGGRGAGLYPLTMKRSEPAVPVAGKYRLIDIPMSNCIHSGLKRIYVLTQFLSVSLHKHLAYTYKFDPFTTSFVEVLHAQQTNEASDWYRGTADAVRQHFRHVRFDPCHQVLILCADQLYRMDFRALVQDHRDGLADVTLAVKPVTAEEASQYGIIRVNDECRITALVEKPTTAEQLEQLRLPPGWLEERGFESNGREFLANTGIYLANRPSLVHLFDTHPAAIDLVTQVFAPNLVSHYVQAHIVDSYWADVGSVRSYYHAHLALTDDEPSFNLHLDNGIIFTRMRHLPAARVSDAAVDHCLLADGSVVEPGATLHRCVVDLRGRVGRNAKVRNTVINGADRYETPAERSANRARGVPDLGVGEGAVIEGAILDKDCRIGRDVQIVNKKKVQHADADNYVIRDGIVVIPNDAVIPDGTVI